MANLRYEHDTLAGNAIQTRLYIDNPAGFDRDILVSGWVDGREVNWTRNLFERFFNNRVQVVHFNHTGAWGQAVRVAAKLDLTGMDTGNLVFYSYDRQANSYQSVRTPNYRIDSNGYLHFTTTLAGDIIISNGPLARR
jgi:hypothetical protein